MRYQATQQGDVIVDGVAIACFPGQFYDLPEEAVAESEADWLVPAPPNQGEPAGSTEEAEPEEKPTRRRRRRRADADEESDE